LPTNRDHQRVGRHSMTGRPCIQSYSSSKIVFEHRYRKCVGTWCRLQVLEIYSPCLGEFFKPRKACLAGLSDACQSLTISKTIVVAYVTAIQRRRRPQSATRTRLRCAGPSSASADNPTIDTVLAPPSLRRSSAASPRESSTNVLIRGDGRRSSMEPAGPSCAPVVIPLQPPRSAIPTRMARRCRSSRSGGR
jgi:hypothetical protein